VELVEHGGDLVALVILQENPPPRRPSPGTAGPSPRDHDADLRHTAAEHCGERQPRRAALRSRGPS
jgi:hypothetical protein